MDHGLVIISIAFLWIATTLMAELSFLTTGLSFRVQITTVATYLFALGVLILILMAVYFFKKSFSNPHY
jgi:hypothetical protein